MLHQLGIDISKKTFDASLLILEKHKYRKFDNNEKGFAELVEWLGPIKSEVHVCIEATGRLWDELAEFLSNQNVLVSVVNPFKIYGFMRSELKRSKTDKLDAETIARFCRAMSPPRWVPLEPKLKMIRDMQRSVDDFKGMIVQETNRLKSGPLCPSIQQRIKNHVAFLKEQVVQLDKEILSHVKSDSQLFHAYELLTSIKGIGQTTAVIFLAELSGFQNFSHPRELEVFCGIAPRQYESGSSVRGRNRISKVGSTRLRTALYMPAVASVRSNPQFKEFYNRLRSAGKPAKVALCAVMRKLLRLMFRVVKSERKYDPNYLSKAPSPVA